VDRPLTIQSQKPHSKVSPVSAWNGPLGGGPSYRSGDVISPRVDAEEPLRMEMLDFCRAVQTGPEPRSSSRMGLDVFRMVESVEQSARQEGVSVSV
jgi:predicted dehydrogenase